MAKLNIDGPRARLNRAIEHSREFDAAFDDYLAQRNITLRLKHHLDGLVDVVFVQREPLPLRLNAIFADMVGNLESALDLLVTQLVIASGNTPSTGNYIPVATTEEQWRVWRPDKLKGVKDEWAEILKTKQPLQDPAHADRHALVLIHSANKINKHTLLIPTVVSSATWEPTFLLNRNAYPQAGDNVVPEPSPHPPGTEIGDGYIIGRARVTSEKGDLAITGFAEKIPGNIKVGFRGFPEGGTGDEQIPDLIAYVMGVLQPFEEILAT